jgi:hypothetical protein
VNAEQDRLRAGEAWRRWGPYASERPAGISDDRQILCLAVALWNERDPILDEGAGAVTDSAASQGGAELEERSFSLDSTPTHSYMRYLYQYPQPFEVHVEYAKRTPEDLLAEVTVWNRGAAPAPLHILPTLWFRNTWGSTGARPALRSAGLASDALVIAARSPELGERFLYCQPGAELLFTDSEHGIDDCVVGGRREAVNRERVGTKACAHYRIEVPGHGAVGLRLRLTDAPAGVAGAWLGAEFTEVMRVRKEEADQFREGRLCT